MNLEENEMKISTQKKLARSTTAVTGILIAAGLFTSIPSAAAAPAIPAPTGVSRHSWIDQVHQQVNTPTTDTTVHQQRVIVRNDRNGNPHTVH